MLERSPYGSRPAPIVAPAPDPMRYAFRYHQHGTSSAARLVGEMSRKPPWPSDGTCPPECPLPKRRLDWTHPPIRRVDAVGLGIGALGLSGAV